MTLTVILYPAGEYLSMGKVEKVCFFYLGQDLILPVARFRGKIASLKGAF